MTAKLITDVFPFRLLPALLFTSITYFLVGLQNHLWNFSLFTLTMVLVSMAAGASSMLISFLFSGFRTVNMVAVVYYLFNFCFGSSLISRINEKTLAQLRYLSFFSYATEALSAIEFDGIEVTNDSEILMGSKIVIQGPAYLLQIGMHVGNLWFDLIMLAMFVIILYFLAFAALYFDFEKTRRHRIWLLPPKPIQ